jgi:aerobic carbon-monoxide dehydrogenase medium subunit
MQPPAPFEYERATSLDGALASLRAHEDARVVAGGHSLLPMMKLRLAVPAVLVDLGRVTDLSYIRDAGDHIAIGALTRHHDVETSDLLRTEVPLLAHTASHVGDPQVRHRGTLGGTLAHSDPASDLPAALLALDAVLVATGPSGAREIRIGEFFTGYFESALADDEVLTEVRVPKLPGVGWSFQKFQRRAQDWAIVGVAAVHGADHSGIGLINMGSTPLRATATESALAGGSNVAEAAAAADDGTEPSADLNASEEYRRHLARVLVRRALEECAARG